MGESGDFEAADEQSASARRWCRAASDFGYVRRGIVEADPPRRLHRARPEQCDGRLHFGFAVELLRANAVQYNEHTADATATTAGAATAADAVPATGATATTRATAGAATNAVSAATAALTAGAGGAHATATAAATCGAGTDDAPSANATTICAEFTAA